MCNFSIFRLEKGTELGLVVVLLVVVFMHKTFKVNKKHILGLRSVVSITSLRSPLDRPTIALVVIVIRIRIVVIIVVVFVGVVAFLFMAGHWCSSIAGFCRFPLMRRRPPSIRSSIEASTTVALAARQIYPAIQDGACIWGNYTCYHVERFWWTQHHQKKYIEKVYLIVVIGHSKGKVTNSVGKDLRISMGHLEHPPKQPTTHTPTMDCH